MSITDQPRIFLQLMKPRYILASSAILLTPMVSRVHAGLTLSADLTFAEQGGTLGAGNLGTSGTAFAKDLLGNGGFAPTHTIPNVNNGTFGNASSWIGNSANSYVGVGFGVAQTIASFAFGRDNTGAFGDRAAGTYTIEYTNDADPATNHATASWTNLGTVTITSGQGVLPALRHRFNINTPISATGIRLFVPGDGIGSGAAVDELEFFSTPGSLVPLPPGIVTTPLAGFSMAWDGNDGDNFSPTGGPVPDNLALPGNGGVSITSSDLGPTIGVPFHVATNLNDGLYGNANSWIGVDSGGPNSAGIMLDGLVDVTSIAWGRDNGLDAANGECCGGQLRDRSLGTYTLQRTIDGTTWDTIGTISYNFDEDDVAGGGFTPHLRHEFEISDGDGGVLAQGMRLLTPNGATAIDEIEIYGTVVPEPAGASLLALGAAAFMRRRRK